MPDREPLEHDHLDGWQVRDLALRALMAGGVADVRSMEARLRGEGSLPSKAGGERILDERLEEAHVAWRNTEAVGGKRLGEQGFSCEVDGQLLTAVATDARDFGTHRDLVWTTASKKANARLQLIGWITALVARVSGAPLATVHLVGCNTTFELRVPDAETARAQLATLVAMYRRVRGGPVMLFPSLSCAVAEGRAKSANASHETLVREAREAWEGGMFSGDADDPWVGALFGHLAFEDLLERADEIVAAAKDVWTPLLAARTAKVGTR